MRIKINDKIYRLKEIESGVDSLMELVEEPCIEDTVRKFKKGDKVRIKHGVSSKTHHNIRPMFLEKMDELIGKTMTVSGYSRKNDYVVCNESGYLFHEDWFEPYTDEPKKGDLAIFWDNDDYKEYTAIRLYDRKDDSVYYGSCHYDSCGISWRNAIKFESKEQYEKLLKGEL